MKHGVQESMGPGRRARGS